MKQTTNKYDLEERTAKFGEQIIVFCKTLKQDAITRPLISQIVRSATSVGANYMEANSASSKADFKNKFHISTYFPNKKDVIKELWKEAQELTLIFGKIVSSLKTNK